jgi:hypothetical protein
MEEKYNTSEILNAVEKILQNSKNDKDEKLDTNKLPTDTIRIITQAENYIKKN